MQNLKRLYLKELKSLSAVQNQGTETRIFNGTYKRLNEHFLLWPLK